nr:MBL fold metallo-hydrolase [Candidatus Sigynarchaeota archaeon]
MEANPIITKPGRIDDCIHLVDVFQYAMKRVCTVFIVETPDAAAIIDTGVSDDVPKILRYMKKHDIPRKKVQFLVPSHFHFDHFGGGWRLWQAIKEENPRVKANAKKARSAFVNGKDGELNPKAKVIVYRDSLFEAMLHR